MTSSRAVDACICSKYFTDLEQEKRALLKQIPTTGVQMLPGQTSTQFSPKLSDSKTLAGTGSANLSMPQATPGAEPTPPKSDV